ncbi:hypothetical protein [Streptomyces sp. CoH17]|uniref:hypothetical protein n=1 Tax=Streptomyces sp. CoH17 TaxID=2992806 RepID=UPI00227004CE|nr:hypothetical protein [Streptomyces sp. CoH17]
MTTAFELPALIASQDAAPTVVRSDDVLLRWISPDIFHELPINVQDDDTAVQLLEELADKALPGADYDEKTKFGVICALAVGDLPAVGVEYAAVCLAVSDETPCIATFFVSLMNSPEVTGSATLVEEISSALRLAKMGDVSVIELPCGSAVACIGNREAEISGELLDGEQGVTLPTSYIQVYLPLPNETTVLMEISTPTMSGWELFSTVFGNIVSSARLFAADGSPLTTSSAGM